MKMNRRVLLRGIGGATFALPWLEGFSAGSAKAQDAQKPYAIIIKSGNGVQQKMRDEPERFWPTTHGTLTDATMDQRAVGELKQWKEKLLIVDGVDYATTSLYLGCNHAFGPLTCFTAQGVSAKTAPRDGDTGSVDVRANGESLDWRIGRELNPAGNEPLALHARQSFDDYIDFMISYRGADQLRSPIVSPKQAYMAVVGEGTGMTDEALVLLQKRRKSVNDLVREQLQAVLASPKLSASDRQRIELHRANVRDLEVAASTMELSAADIAELQKEPSSDKGNGDTVIQLAKLHMMVAAFAVASGYTRSVALQIGGGNDQTQYRGPNGETYERFHYVSHRINSDGCNGSAIANADLKHHEIDKLFMRTFGFLLERLNAYDMPDGKTLLDHGISLWTNDLASGPDHSFSNLPYVIAGSANGKLKQGKFVDGNGKHNQLLNTIGAAVGVKNAAGTGPLNDFGASGLTKGGLTAVEA